MEYLTNNNIPVTPSTPVTSQLKESPKKDKRCIVVSNQLHSDLTDMKHGNDTYEDVIKKMYTYYRLNENKSV